MGRRKGVLRASSRFTDIVDGTRVAAGGLSDFATGLVNPSVRLGVTGLSRAGKTVFITALVNALLKGGRFPAFEALGGGRITRCYLEPQPDDTLPRFAFESHVKALSGEARHWPESTSRISQLRITAEYTPVGFLARNLGSGRLHIDIVDYPGEWLLDLPLMRMSYAEWSAATVAASRVAPRLAHAGEWHALLSSLDPARPADEQDAISSAEVFTAYLARCRKEDVSLSTLPPGRFLMPGDYKGSPLLAFAPLDIAPDTELHEGLARRADGAALPGLCLHHREAVLLWPFRQARPADRAGRCADRAECRCLRGARICSRR